MRSQLKEYRFDCGGDQQHPRSDTISRGMNNEYLT